jgi:hypothetical protein
MSTLVGADHWGWGGDVPCLDVLGGFRCRPAALSRRTTARRFFTVTAAGVPGYLELEDRRRDGPPGTQRRRQQRQREMAHRQLLDREVK